MDHSGLCPQLILTPMALSPETMEAIYQETVRHRMGYSSDAQISRDIKKALQENRLKYGCRNMFPNNGNIAFFGSSTKTETFFEHNNNGVLVQFISMRPILRPYREPMATHSRKFIQSNGEAWQAMGLSGLYWESYIMAQITALWAKQPYQLDPPRTILDAGGASASIARGSILGDNLIDGGSEQIVIGKPTPGRVIYRASNESIDPDIGFRLCHTITIKNS